MNMCERSLEEHKGVLVDLQQGYGQLEEAGEIFSLFYGEECFYDRAKILAGAVFKSRERRLGSQDPLVLRALWLNGRFCDCLGDPHLALEFLEQAWKGRDLILGESP